MNSHKRAFTLIELLVVIAIIAILAAILFPVFAQAKAAAKKSVCISNMKQQALAFKIYSNDSDDMLPASNEASPITDTASCRIIINGVGGAAWCPGDNRALGWKDPAEVQNWAAEIFPYVKSTGLYICPSALNVSNNVFGFLSTSGAGNSSYALNGNASGKSDTTAGSPATLIVLQGADATSRDAYVQPTPLPTLGITNGIDINWMGNNHGAGDDYAFADGHAKFYNRTQVTFKMYGIDGPVNDYGGTGPGTGTVVPNTTGMSDPKTNPSRWWTWGTNNISNIQ